MAHNPVMNLTVESLHCYPVKSCGAVTLIKAEVTQSGFRFDRMWIIVDDNGKMITQRQYPKLALVAPYLSEDRLTLDTPGADILEIFFEFKKDRIQTVNVWGTLCQGAHESKAADAWFSTLLETQVRLLRFDDDVTRKVGDEWMGTVPSKVAFADTTPYSIATVESLQALNHMRKKNGAPPVHIDRFRPNIVVSGGAPWDEDHWGALMVDDSKLKFDITAATPRCQVIDIDQSSGDREKGSQSNLKTLTPDRHFIGVNGKPGIMFGVDSVVTRGFGEVIKVGDTLHIGQPTEGLPLLPRISPVKK